MSRLIGSIISALSPPHFPLIILQSSLVQSSLPVLRAFARSQDAPTQILLFSLLYPPQTLVEIPYRDGLTVVDRTTEVPGYGDTCPDLSQLILSTIKQVPDGPLTAIIDSADVLCSDLESPSKTYALLVSLLSHLSTRPKPSRLILHFSTHSSPLLNLVLTPRFSPTLAHITAHPPALLLHLATTQLTPPPPISPPERFWPIFAPLASRTWEVERILLGLGCAGPSDDGGEMVIELLTRPRGGGRSVEKELHGWKPLDGPCSLSDLDSLKPVLEGEGKTGRGQGELTSDVSFNLSLTPEQRKSRAKVALPYAHKRDYAILYEPDSADDIDDDDPDEDLDI